MVLVTREFKFDAAHYLKGYAGDCANLHGHTWRFAVTIGGNTVDEVGMLVDFKTIKKVVQGLIIDKVDHKCLNDVLPFNPTAENISAWIFQQLSLVLNSLFYKLVSVKVWENYPECYVEVIGD